MPLPKPNAIISKLNTMSLSKLPKTPKLNVMTKSRKRRNVTKSRHSMRRSMPKIRSGMLLRRALKSSVKSKPTWKKNWLMRPIPPRKQLLKRN